MSSIVLSTLNARYSHCAFGLRYIYANMQELQSETKLLEFTINQNTRDIVEGVLAQEPKIVGFGVYIWNTRQTFEVVSMLKRIRPDLKIVLGGPEVTYETELQDICKTADLTIKGESDFLFYEVCRKFLENGEWPKTEGPANWVSGELPLLNKLVLPYDFYSDHDVQNRVIYVEASRGCPYKCEYCLSSLDKSVRAFDTDLFLSEMEKLIKRGARQFKFVDRTFNLSISTSLKILNFFYERVTLGLFLHFEMVPDRLPVELRDLIKKFPDGSLQFEIGIQTWNPEVAKLVSRRQDYTKIRENFAFLTKETGVHLHADLIAGLPGETLESFADGFDALSAIQSDEIQVGILKRLRGTPIVRHDLEWKMKYQEHAPYQVLETKTMGFSTLQGLARFSHFWNLVANSGNFKKTMEIVKALGRERSHPSYFWQFNDLAQFLGRQHPQGHSVSLLNLMKSVWLYLKDQPGVDVNELRDSLIYDYNNPVSRDIPTFLKDETKSLPKIKIPHLRSTIPPRQRRHLDA